MDQIPEIYKKIIKNKGYINQVPEIYICTDEYREKFNEGKIGCTTKGAKNRISQLDGSSQSSKMRLVEAFPVDFSRKTRRRIEKEDSSNRNWLNIVENKIHNHPRLTLVRQRREWVTPSKKCSTWKKALVIFREVILEVIDFYGNQQTKLERFLTRRYYQSIAILKGTRHLLQNDRVSLNLCPRSGKTIIGIDIWTELRKLDENIGTTVVQFEPSCMLVSQNSKAVVERLRSLGYKVRHIELGDEISTSYEDLLGFVKDSTEKTVNLITSTYQSKGKIKKVFQELNKEVDFMICDEAHRLCGRTDKLWNKVCMDSYITCKKRLFITGSPKKYLGENTKFFGFNNINMFGDIVYTYTLRQGIADGYISPYKVFGFDINEDKVEEFRALYLRHQPVIAKNLYNLDGIEFDDIKKDCIPELADPVFWMQVHNILNAIKNGTVTHPIVYANRVMRAKIFIRIIQHLAFELYDIDIPVASTLDSSMSLKSRNKLLQQEFKRASLGVIANVNCLKEGIDVSAIDSIFFIDPKMSGVDLVQIICRCLTFAPNKIAKIFVPVLLEKNGDETTITSSRYRKAIEWIVSLAGSDKHMLKDIIDNIEYYDATRADGIVEKVVTTRRRGRLTGTSPGGVRRQPLDMDFEDTLHNDCISEFLSSDTFTGEYNNSESKTVSLLLTIANDILQADKKTVKKALSSSSFRNIDLDSMNKKNYIKLLKERAHYQYNFIPSNEQAYNYLKQLGLGDHLNYITSSKTIIQRNLIKSLYE
jgi:predicted helicase